MKKSEFVRIMETVIAKVESEAETWTCNELEKHSLKLRNDYANVFSKYKNNPGYLPAAFGLKLVNIVECQKVKQIRLNALTMYMVQALEFETYKDL